MLTVAALKRFARKRFFYKLVVYGIIALLTCSFAYVLIKHGDYSVPKHEMQACISIYTLIGIASVVAIIEKCGEKLEYIFLFMYIYFGVLTLVLIPPGSTPDYAANFLRAYEIAGVRVF